MLYIPVAEPLEVVMFTATGIALCPILRTISVTVPAFSFMVYSVGSNATCTAVEGETDHLWYVCTSQI